MPVVETRSVFSGIPVSEAMRRQVVSLPFSADIGQGIRMMTRYKANAVLLTDKSVPFGVVSKTDLMGAFYADFPTDTPLSDVMGSQPIACFPDDPLENALEIMNTPVHSVPAEELLSTAIQQMLINDVQRLFVHREASNPDLICGVLALSDSARFRSGSCRACTAGRMLT